jgi:hypothetical protein
MSDQSNQAAKFMREKLGAKVDELVPPGTHLREADKNEPPKVPWIELPGGGDRLITEFAKEMGDYLAEAPIFRRDRVAVVVNEESGSLDVLDASMFRTEAEKYVIPYKARYVKQGNDIIREQNRMSMAKECAEGTLRADVFRRRLRRIARVNLVPMPVMRSDGRLELLKVGYDEESETYTLPSAVTISEEMTAEQGAAVWRDYYAEFPFTDDRSRAVAMAEAVALFVPGLQELTANRMGFLFKSNKERTGKSLAAQFGIAPCYGLAEGQTISGQEEMKKLLDATALEGKPYLFFDNLTGNVKSNLLESFMTTPKWTGRVFGSNSKTFSAEKGTIVIITGNNITTSADIAGRCLLCVLRTEDADPQARVIKRVFTPQRLATPKVRSDLLSALWAMVRGWDKAGRKPASRRIAGFEEWSDLVGGIVVSAGFVCPLQKPKDEETTNTAEVDARVLVGKLADGIPSDRKSHEYVFQDLVDVCYANNCFDWKLDGKIKKDGDSGEEWFECNKASSSALGRIFNESMAGQIYRLDDGRRVRFGKQGQARHKRFLVEIIAEPGK